MYRTPSILECYIKARLHRFLKEDLRKNEVNFFDKLLVYLLLKHVQT